MKTNIMTTLKTITTKEEFDNLKVNDLFLKSNGRMTTATFKVKKINEYVKGTKEIFICYVGEYGIESDVIKTYTMYFTKHKFWGEFWELKEVNCSIKLTQSDILN